MSFRQLVLHLFVCSLVVLNVAAQTPPSVEDLEMGVRTAPKEKANVDPEVFAKFVEEYLPVFDAPRLVFAKYAPLLGSAAILDYLEEKYPACHGQSHDLGKALYALNNDLGQALRDCGTRCTSGCMHGAVGEAFGGSSPEILTAKMNTFCGEGEMGRLHKPGNCAHAFGHALMFVNSGEVSKAIEGCLGFNDEPMQYYCATGVFMEKILTGPKSTEPPSSPHAPCDEETLFPTACYRYKSVDLLRKFRDPRILARQCLSLPESQRLGCFHGLGAAVMGSILKDPKTLGSICSQGNASDRIVCVEGAMEKVSEFDEERARAACATLQGELRTVCDAAVDGKMYRLEKKTWDLYYDREEVAKRRAAVAGSDGGAEHRH